MVSLFQQRFEERVRSADARAFGVSVTLKRGQLESNAFTATFEKPPPELIGEETFLTKAELRTWMFAVTDAALRGTEVEPRQGDRIIDGTKEFEVTQLNDGPAVELMQGDYRWRVHTKRVA